MFIGDHHPSSAFSSGVTSGESCGSFSTDVQSMLSRKKTGTEHPKKRAAWLVLVGTNSSLYRNPNNLSHSQGDSTMLCPLIQMKPCRWKAQPGNPFAVCKHDVWFDSKIWPQQISGMWPNKTPSPNGRFIFGFVGLPTLMKAVPWSMQCRQREPGQGPQHCTLVSFIR